ncbi:type III pantothenate kinase [Lacisediminimonas sp.]|uniref:type III pantothenate kinase n=1 Tax=Lacisediminimonas sp. TaxID=3060582 RepID=UPI002716C89A|nr:type III pantothenate kinase [Lacisediminimonas sp.]MDO8299375.1 type III pantothenate kinase [Lacisediminimonas sp.]
MLLLIDAGNTRIKWALAPDGPASPGQWLQSGVVEHATLPSLAAQLAAATAAPGASITRVMLSNVAGDAVRSAVLAMLHQCFGERQPALEIFKSSAARAGLRNGYRQPAQLGTDRFAAAIGARALYPGQALVLATCGTATTIDAISADGVFLGGMILPGLRLMASVLAEQTAQLPQVAERIDAGRPFADNTEEAIVLGCLSAQAGAIERALARHPGARCILSGGAGRMVAPLLAVAPEFIDNLVLIGLQLAAMEETPQC